MITRFLCVQFVHRTASELDARRIRHPRDKLHLPGEIGRGASRKKETCRFLYVSSKENITQMNTGKVLPPSHAKTTTNLAAESSATGTPQNTETTFFHRAEDKEKILILSLSNCFPFRDRFFSSFRSPFPSIFPFHRLYFSGQGESCFLFVLLDGVRSISNVSSRHHIVSFDHIRYANSTSVRTVTQQTDCVKTASMHLNNILVQ